MRRGQAMRGGQGSSLALQKSGTPWQLRAEAKLTAIVTCHITGHIDLVFLCGREQNGAG
jgi:hypothetical protein